MRSLGVRVGSFGVAFGFFLAGFVFAPAQAAVRGHWEGAVELPGQQLEVDVDLAETNGAWTGDISIPAQGAKDLPLEKIVIQQPSVSFAITGIPGEPTFTGTLSEDGQTISGNFSQAGQSFSFKLSSELEPATKARRALEGLEPVLTKALADWSTPGLALGVIVDGEVVLAQGFGYRDLEEKLPVTAQTLFAIGSATKAFTATTLGTLVQEGKLDWDEPVRAYLPELVLHDEYASEHITLRDMLSHRSGLPRHDLVWYNNESITRAELVRRLRFLEPNRELRQEWQYNNLMFVTAGFLTERLTGMSWEDAVRARILSPLGMTRTNFSVHDSQQVEDHALPYLVEDNVARRVDFRPIGVAGPAGSINSCVDDMLLWVQANLGGRGGLPGSESGADASSGSGAPAVRGSGSTAGRPNPFGRDASSVGASIISPSTLQELHTAVAVINGAPTEEHSSLLGYALGWMVDSWYGHQRVFHGGNIDGFSALVTFFPKDDLGIVAFSNRNGDALPALATAEVADRILDIEAKEDRFVKANTERTEWEAFSEQGEAAKARFRKENTKPSRPLADFAGDYGNDGYGPVEVRLEKKALSVRYNDMTLPLEHWHYDVFTVPEIDDEIIPEDIRLSFRTNAQGNLDGFEVTLEPMVDPIYFERQPDKRLRDPAFLARLVGDYDLPGDVTMGVTLAGETLSIQVTGQPALKLRPSGIDEFQVEEVDAITVRFTVPAQGPATEAILVQPEGVFVLPRMEQP